MRRSFGITRVSSIVSVINFLDFGLLRLGSGLGVNRSLEGSSTFAFFIVSSLGSFIVIFSCVLTIWVKVFSGPNVFSGFTDFGSCEATSLMDVLAKVAFFIFS